MHGTRVLNVLVVALSTLSAAQAILIDPAFRSPRIGHIGKRQRSADPTGQGANTSPTTLNIIVSTSLGLTLTTPTTSSVLPTSSSPSPQSSKPQTTGPTPTSIPTTTTTRPTTSAPPETTSTTTSSSSEPSLVVLTSTLVLMSTRPDGVQTSYTTEQVSTSTPDLASTQSSGQTGMSTQTRNTVIGVVVGIGGAVILAGVAFLALRLYRKKQPEESDGLMDYNAGYNANEKSDVASSASQPGRSPFQSTLETYHAPTQVNTASNF